MVHEQLSLLCATCVGPFVCSWMVTQLITNQLCVNGSREKCHTTNVTQPLQRSICFSKVALEGGCREFIAKIPGQVVTSFQFLELFCKAYTKAMTIGMTTEGFHVTGVYPFNWHATVAHDPEPDLAQKMSLACIPMCSPMHRTSVMWVINVPTQLIRVAAVIHLLQSLQLFLMTCQSSHTWGHRLVQDTLKSMHVQ